MLDKRVNSWPEFRAVVADIRGEYAFHDVDIGENQPYKMKNTVLFRGHCNSDWRLQTSLERKTTRRIHVAHYATYVSGCVAELESLTGRSWGTRPHPDMMSEIDENQDAFRVYLPNYDYLVYLRQHGFPSPLLDWTASPFIAAFFAFWQRPESENVAVYLYVDSVDGGQSRFAGAPQIRVQGPYVTTHQRHFAQQACYTTATTWMPAEGKHYFCSHHDVFKEGNRDQDILIKITLPSSIRPEALQDLADHNINPFTLFQTEDSLVKAMELKAFDLSEN